MDDAAFDAELKVLEGMLASGRMKVVGIKELTQNENKNENTMPKLQPKRKLLPPTEQVKRKLLPPTQ